MRHASNPPQFRALEELVRSHPHVFVEGMLHPTDSDDQEADVSVLCCQCAIEILEWIHGAQCPHLFQALLTHAHFSCVTGMKHEALAHAKRAWQLCIEGEPNHRELPWATAVYAERLNGLGRHGEAEHAVKHACQIMSQVGEGCFSLGSVLDLQWQYVEALRAQGRQIDDAWKRQLDRYRQAWRDEIRNDSSEEGRAGR